MKSIRSVSGLRVVLFGLPALAFAACTAPGGPDAFRGQNPSWAPPGAQDGADAGIMQVQEALCSSLSSSQPMPARATVITTGVGDMVPSTSANGTTYFTTDLFGLFKSNCGSCHVETNLGMWQVKSSNFAQLVTQDVIDNRIKSKDPTVWMPPAPMGVEFDTRSPNDPIVQLVSLLQAWIDQGSPSDAFTLASQGDTGPTMADYTVTTDLSGQLTNIGTCVPNKAMYGTSTTMMDDLDAFFAAATQLPDTIDKTDLVSLDSATLAQVGVLSYAPAYPLWSDDAGKMRYVRVPRGKTIAFDKAQIFTIPPNTRFYKTFLKQVTDADGNQSFRKIETRLIVSRPDEEMPDGTVVQKALYGTYVWNDDETSATLLTDPLRDGTPFRDRVITYFVDEPKAQMIIDSKPLNLDFALEVENTGVVRHYALPGSARCVACHMGSPSAAFVLGFTPLQVARRPAGQSGVIEPPAGDELTQLQRLIDLKVISGMTSPDDVLPLEKSEGTRTPRNQNELTAQAYMLGNCSHCHNPRGFPSTKEPLLKNVLDFLPSQTGGVFQLPLSLTSPVRFRAEAQDVALPYLTPSLRDYPDVDHYPKGLACAEAPKGFCKAGSSEEFVDAPWRSLIYRNVDTPFDYVDDFTIFPHMPLNSAGYDCRAARFLGDWMVSIPSKLAHPNLDENAIPDDSGKYPANVNRDPQPYVEVLQGDPAYADAVTQAQARLAQYHAGHRYDFCADTSDIVDPVITDQVNRGVPVQLDTKDTYDPKDPTKLLMPDLGTPIRPDWIVTDTTNLPGDWYPRRPDWQDAVVSQKVSNTPVFLQPDDVESLTDVVTALGDLKLTNDVRTALTRVMPFGLWQQKPGCKFDGIPAAGTFQGANRPDWMKVVPPADSAPVYTQSAGAAIFRTICFNCHGLKADSNGLLADEITLMTGGDARVANFRDGILGPLSSPGMNRANVFGAAAQMAGLTADDYAARYMSWMALGGTGKNLPSALLGLVSNVPVLGAHRSHIDQGGNPNMLQLGFQLCSGILTATANVKLLNLQTFFTSATVDWSDQTALIDGNGDAELWLRICNLSNRAVVRVPSVTISEGRPTFTIIGETSLYWGDAYPATAPVMDQHGQIHQGLQMTPDPVTGSPVMTETGLSTDNLFPICVRKPPLASDAQIVDDFLKANPVGGSNGNVIPYCPPEVLAAGNQLQAVHRDDGSITYTDAKKWAARGAINAGAAVFLYLDQLERGIMPPQPLSTQCDLLGSTTGTHP